MQKDAKVSAHNELRVSDGGRLVLQGGTIESARWIDIQYGGSFEGYGKVKADLFTKGTLYLSAKKSLVVEGNACLSGELKLIELPLKQTQKILTLLSANSISGTFVNNEVTVSGKTFSLFYSPTEVTLKQN